MSATSLGPPHGAEPAFQVVTAPDFTGPRRAEFELQALLFLGCWLESGAAGRWPLTLACIGEPSPAVAALAALAGAEISVHPPLVVGTARSFNKLRGLEVSQRAAQVLLLDTDVMVLGDLAAITAHCGAIAAGPAGHARIPDDWWARLYQVLGVPGPTQRFASLRAALGLPETERFSGQAAQTKAMLAYYNSGVVFAPWDCGLRARWEAVQNTIRSCFAPHEPNAGAVLQSDQAAFAASLHLLALEGWRIELLAPELHARLPSLLRRAACLKQVQLLHLTGLFSDLAVPGRTLEQALRVEGARYRRRMRRLWWRADRRGAWLRTGPTQLLPALADAWRLEARLRRIIARHVAPVLAHTPLCGPSPP